MNRDTSGQVVTFYSYKGGTGRTMTLANVAWILAANGLRVLVTDWDLESPGLHRFFRPFLDDAVMSSTPGIIDMIREYQWATLQRPETRRLDYHRDYAQVQRYAVSLDWDFPDGGRLDLLSAGRQNRDYSSAVASIDWDAFYAEHGGGLFFDALREDMRSHYDYTLIDSRTGLSDIADICTVHLPDILVDCFTLSDQGIEGASSVARTIATDYRDRNIKIFPVAMRIDEGEKEKADAGRALARARFDGFPTGLSPDETNRYWGSVEVPYRAFYAYEETLAAFGDPPGMSNSMLAAMERLAAWVTDGAVTALPPNDEAERSRVLRAFTRRRPPSPGDLLLAYVPEDRAWVDWIAAVLNRASISVVLKDCTHEPPTDLHRPVWTRTMVVLSPAFVRSRAAMEFARTVADTDPSGARGQLMSVLVGRVRPAEPVTARIAADLTENAEISARELLLTALNLPDPGTSADNLNGVRFPGSSPRIWNLQPRNETFTGRNPTLERLRDQLATRAVSVVLPVALHGLGGVGKTQIALEYAHRFKSDYDLVWWVDAEQPDEITRSLAQLAAALGIEEVDHYTDNVRQVLDKLRRGNPYSRWLLIFDNADDPSELRPFLSGGPGHVLITSRNQSWTQLAEPLEVDIFTRSESTDLLLRRVPSLAPAEAEQIAELLGDLPLAVELASAMLAESALPGAEFIASLNQKGGTAALSETLSLYYPRSLASMWSISLDRLGERSPAALRLLELSAFFASEISATLIYSQRTIEALLPMDGSLRDPMMLSRVVSEINRLALVRVDQTAGSIRVHRLLQSYLRDQMDASKREALVRQVHQILVAARPQYRDTNDLTTLSQYALIWPHLAPSDAASSDEHAVRQLLIDQVNFLWTTGDFGRGLELALRLEQTWQDSLLSQTAQAGAEERQEPQLLRRQLLHLRFQRANIHRSLGEVQKAANLSRAVLDEQSRLLPPEHLHTLITASGLAADLRALGRYAEALELDESTHASLKQLFGQDHPRTLAAASNLGSDCRLTGDCFAALEYDQDVLERRIAIFGSGHAFTLRSKVNVANDLRETGDHQQSIAILRAAYAEFARAVGDNSPESLRTAISLSASLRRAGEFAQARATTEAAYAALERAGNADSLNGCAFRASLAADLAATGEATAAVDLIRDVHQDYVRRLGEQHPFTLASLHNLALYLGRADRAAEALDAATICAEGFAETQGPNGWYTLVARLTLADCHKATGDVQQAARLRKATCLSLRNVLGEDHPTTRAANDGARYDRELEPQLL